MSLLDKLGINKDKRKTKMPLGLNYLQQQEWKRSQQKKNDLEREERTARISTPQPKERPCPICEKPLIVPVGTVMHCHKECKPRFKRAVRRLEKRS